MKMNFDKQNLDTKMDVSDHKPTETQVERTSIYCVPGDRLCKADEKTMPAAGTYKSENHIYASLAGQVVINHTGKDIRFIGVSLN